MIASDVIAADDVFNDNTNPKIIDVLVLLVLLIAYISYTGDHSC